jgi:hypothetical protein
MACLRYPAHEEKEVDLSEDSVQLEILYEFKNGLSIRRILIFPEKYLKPRRSLGFYEPFS